MKRLFTSLLVGIFAASFLVLPAQARGAQSLEERLEKARQEYEEDSSTNSVKAQKKYEERVTKIHRKEALKNKRATEKAMKPKVFQGKLTGVDVAGSKLLLKKNGRFDNVQVTAKTVLTVIEVDGGARVATLADFAADDKVFGLVTKNTSDHTLTGVVLVKMPAKPKKDDDDENEVGSETPPTPQTDGTTNDGSTPPAN